MLRLIVSAVLLLASFGASAQTYSIWSTSDTPASSTTGNGERGEKFQASVDGYIIGFKYYKHASGSGTAVMTLWTGGGSSITTCTFSNETASGWQTCMLSVPQAITASTDYWVTRTYNSSGTWAYTGSTSYPINNSPLTASDAKYNATPGSFPNTAASTTKYFNDVIFVKKTSTFILIPNN